MEQQELQASQKAERLMNEFGKYFAGVFATFHPHGMPGEMAGKSSNVAWCARKIMEEHRYREENVIVTVIDGKLFSRNVCLVLFFFR